MKSKQKKQMETAKTMYANAVHHEFLGLLFFFLDQEKVSSRLECQQ